MWGGLPEVNIQGKTGFLSEVGNVDEMAANALYILSSEEILQIFRDNAYAHARKFDIKHVLPHYISFYEKLVGVGV